MFPGYWTMPGGRGEDGESLEDTAIREVKEEIGLAFFPEKVVQKSVIEHSGELRETFTYKIYVSKNSHWYQTRCIFSSIIS